jgi:hypothetical protein
MILQGIVLSISTPDQDEITRDIKGNAEYGKTI